MVSPIFIVGSISGWVIVTRSVPSGKWEIRAIRGTFVPYEKRMGWSGGSWDFVVFAYTPCKQRKGQKPRLAAHFGSSQASIIFSASPPENQERNCSSMYSAPAIGFAQ